MEEEGMHPTNTHDELYEDNQDPNQEETSEDKDMSTTPGFGVPDEVWNNHNDFPSDSPTDGWEKEEDNLSDIYEDAEDDEFITPNRHCSRHPGAPTHTHVPATNSNPFDALPNFFMITIQFCNMVSEWFEAFPAFPPCNSEFKNLNL